MKSKVRHFIYGTATVLFFLLLTVVLGEGYLRWFYFGLPTAENHRPHPYLQTRLRLDKEIKKNEYLDENGFRKTGRLHEGPQVYKILTIGDSCTFSITSSREKNTYPSLLEKGLHDRFGSLFEVYNAGVPGYNSMQMFLWLSQILEKVNPHEVIIYGGWNDFRILMHDRGALYIENNCLGMPRMYRRTSYWELEEKYKGGIHTILSKSYLLDSLYFKIKSYFMKKKMTRFWKKNPLTRLPPHPIAIEAIFENFQKNVENMIALCKGRNLNVSIITLGTPLRKEYTRSQESMIKERFGRDFLRLTPAEMAHYVFRFNRILRDLSRKYQCRLYDWEKWYHGMDDAAMFVDLVHPSDKGYRHLVARVVESADY